jgi:multiple sugar transport system substrate-binding protein
MEEAVMSEKLSRRTILHLASLSVAGAAFAACAPTAAPAPAPAESGDAPAAETTTVRYNCRAGVQGDYFTQEAEFFMEANPDIEVVVEAFPGANPEYLQKIATMIVGGTVGDIMWTASIHNYYNYVAAGTYVAIDEFVTAENYDLSVFYPVAVDACKFEGVMYSLPWIVHPGRIGLFYNKTAFDEAGMDVPSAEWTYDDLNEAAVAMTKSEGDQITQWGFLPTTDYFGLVIPIRSYGGDWLDPEGVTCTVDQEPAVQGLTLWQNFYQELNVAPTPAQVDDVAQMWASGRIVMVQSGYWGQSWGKNFVKDFEWMVAPMPQGPSGSQSMFEFDGNVILAQSQVIPQAWEFMKHCSTKDAGVHIAEAGSVPGGRPDVWDDPGLMAFEPHAVFAEIMQGVAPLVLPHNFRYEELFQIASNEFDPVWSGESTIEEVIGNVQASMQAVLDMPRV